MRRLAVLAMAALVAGCAGPRALAPAVAGVEAPAEYRTADGQGRAVDAGWWGAFGDPVLTRMVETALARDTDIAAAAARVEEARAAYRFAEAQRLPNLSGLLSGAHQRDVSPFGQPREQTAGQAGLSVSYDLDLFGRLAAAGEAARASLLATEAARDGVRLAVAAATASGYLNLCALDARLAVLRSTLDARDQSLKLTRRRAEAGYSPQLDLRQAQADYEATRALIPSTLAAIARQENGLALLLGDTPHAIMRGRPLAELVVPPIAAGLPASLLRRRPDLAQAEQQLAASDRSLDAARAAFMPNVQLAGSGGFAASTLLSNPIAVFSAGGSVLAPLFDSGRLKAQQSVAVARRDQAAFAYRKAALTAFREVDDALTAQARTADQTEVLVAQETVLAGALTLATNRYRAGYSPYFEQLDAQRNLLAVDLAIVQARADRLAAAVALFQALGGGWTSERSGPGRPDAPQ